MIDPEVEELIIIKDVCKMFPGRAGKGISLSTIWRWMLHGCRGHKLEWLLIGGQRYTSRQAVLRHLAAINAGQGDITDQAANAAERDQERVARECEHLRL